MVGPNNCGKTLLQEKVISPLLGSSSAKCQKYLLDKTEFNADLIANCHWVLSDSIAELDWKERKALTENIKEAIVNSEQRLRGMYSNPCTVFMCPRISCSINWPSVESLPIYEEGMADKMMLLKVEKSSVLPDITTPRLAFEAQLRKELPAFAYYLKHEFLLDEKFREAGNIRFGVSHPANAPWRRLHASLVIARQRLETW
jgi:hypothetical protein